jgi:uncharacterized protein YjdB
VLVACSGSDQTPTPTATTVATQSATATPVPSATTSGTPSTIPLSDHNATPAASLAVTPKSATLAIGQSRQILATLKDAAGNVITDLMVTWSSSKPSSVAVSATGLVTGISPGEATITANSGGVTGMLRVEIAEITVASVTVSPQSAMLTRGQARQLSATINDANSNVLTGFNVNWSSSNPSSATVSATGLITGITSGSATITATSEGKSGTALITVTDATVASVTVSPQSATVAIGQARQFVASISDVAGTVLTGLTPTWSSSNQSTVTVSATGLVTGSAPGSATITATSEGKTGTSLVTVTDATVASVALTTQSATVTIGQSRQLKATMSDASGSVLTGLIATWSSSNPSVASVSSAGLVSGVASGSATITATSAGKSGTVLITVANASVASVAVSPQSSSLVTGQTQQLLATLKDAGGNVLSGSKVTWSSSNASSTIISATGLVMGIGPGFATITATSEGKTGTALITVNKAPVASVKFPTVYVVLLVGQSQQLAVMIKDADGNVLGGRVKTWSSSDASIVNVSTTGLVTGLKQGSVTITVTSEGISDTRSVEVLLIS